MCYPYSMKPELYATSSDCIQFPWQLQTVVLLFSWLIKLNAPINKDSYIKFLFFFWFIKGRDGL